MKTKIILVARDCDSSCIVYNYLSKSIDIDFVIFERAMPKKKQFWKRVKKLGFLRAASQVIFMLTIFPFIKLFSQQRKRDIFSQYELDEKHLPAKKVIRVETLNSDESRKLLRRLAPDLVLVNGTRIISKKTLEEVGSTFINIHTGITPLFRGVHGGYWAVAKGKKNLFGTTIHYVDSGVDTGAIIEQVFTVPTKADTFYTYPYLQYAVCLPVLKRVVASFLAGKRPETRQPVTTESALWFHPTVTQWLVNLRRTCIFVLLLTCHEFSGY
jgi:folate-dependent phosphoribosylglycinamide formyltransferase PurN